MTLKISDAGSLQSASASQIQGPDLSSSNVPGQPEAVTLTRLPNPVTLDQPVVLPPHSITVRSIPCGK